MKIEQIYTGCLAQGAYYIESDGEAVIIDPLREIQPYLDLAKRRKAKIKYIFETHFHADFVSGHVDLAKKTNATIVYGPTEAPLGFSAHIAKDGEIFKIGKSSFTLLHTPGHTLESSCFLLKDENDVEKAIFTGDTLFIGDVGRPDLAQKSKAGLTREKLASYLFQSLREKIMPLADDLIVYPAHGAGSACGKNMSSETFDSLGNQKKTNYALNPDLSEEEFIAQVLDGLQAPPAYFPKNVKLNIEGYDSFDQVMTRGNKALSAKEFEVIANETKALILDTRSKDEFVKSFIPNSIFIGIDGSFAVWVGTLIPDLKQEILLVTDKGREEEVITRLARVGYDHAIGYLDGGFQSWKDAGKEVDQMASITVNQLIEKKALEHNLNILDVRKPSEFSAEHMEDAINTPLDFINDTMAQINKEKEYLMHCKSGYRSVIFGSILKARGFDNLTNIEGGYEAVSESKAFVLTDFVCPSTLKN